MDYTLSRAIEKRLQLHPNKATIGVQAAIQEYKTGRLQAFAIIKRDIPAFSTSLSVENHSKDANVGTDPESLEPNQSKTQRRSMQTTLKYRNRGIMAAENKQLESIDRTNRNIKIELIKAKKYLIGRMESHNERPPGTPHSIKFTPSQTFISSNEVESKKSVSLPRSFLTDSINYIDHNRENLFNIKTVNSRPVSDSRWIRNMRKSAGFYTAFLRETESLDSEIGRHQDVTIRSRRRDNSVSLNLEEFGELKGEVMVNPSYIYCSSCTKNTSPIQLKGKDLRPRLKIRSQ